MRIRYSIVLSIILMSKMVLADGMSFKNGHFKGEYTTINFTAQQLKSVDQYRIIRLTDKQFKVLKRFNKRIPKVLHVMTIQEVTSDCTCFVNNVVIWTGLKSGEIPHPYIKGSTSNTNRGNNSIFILRNGSYCASKMKSLKVSNMQVCQVRRKRQKRVDL